MFTKVLAAFDGSNLSQKALKKAVELAKEHGSELCIIHVYQLPALIVGEAYVTAPPQIESDTINKAELVLQQAHALAAVIPNVSCVLKYGRPAEAILEYADSTGADLIVLGSRGLSGIKEFMLGSVSHSVVQHSKVPVLVVK